MIRPATEKDISAIARSYEALFDREDALGSTTNWARGIYPTVKVPMEKVPRGEMYILEEEGLLRASMVLNGEQAPEYRVIPWQYPAEDSEVLVIHTLCVPPAHTGHGYGAQMVRFAIEHASKHGCRAVRIDTWTHNEAAKGFYTKLGFRLAGTHQALHQGLIAGELAYLEYRIG